MSYFLRQSFLVLHNPAAGRRKQSRILDIVGRLQQTGARVDIAATSGPGHAVELAFDAALKGSHACIVAAGGDGTISETATGLLRAREHAARYEDLPPLGVLPMGTANVMAQDLGLTTLGGIARRKITRMLAIGKPRPLHLGLIENDVERRAFVMMVGAGFDGAVVADIDLGFKRRFGKLAYVKSGLTAFWRGGAPTVVLSGEVPGPVNPSQWVIISNGQHYAGGYLLSRRTSLFQKNLLCLALSGSGRRQILRGNIALAAGRLDRAPYSACQLGSTFELTCNKDEGLVEVDGDYFGRLPVKVGISDMPIPFLTPV